MNTEFIEQKEGVLQNVGTRLVCICCRRSLPTDFFLVNHVSYSKTHRFLKYYSHGSLSRRCSICRRNQMLEQTRDARHINIDARLNKRSEFCESEIKGGTVLVVGVGYEPFSINHTMTGKEGIVLASEVAHSIQRHRGE